MWVSTTTTNMHFRLKGTLIWLDVGLEVSYYKLLHEIGITILGHLRGKRSK